MMKIKICRNNYNIGFFIYFIILYLIYAKHFHSFHSHSLILTWVMSQSKTIKNVCKFSNSVTPFLAVATEYKLNKKKNVDYHLILLYFNINWEKNQIQIWNKTINNIHFTYFYIKMLCVHVMFEISALNKACLFRNRIKMA